MIEFDGLAKHYGDFAAVQDLTFRVKPGEVYALLGANGAGKTTALRCLATLLAPTAGTARIDGFDVREMPIRARSRLGFLSASMGLYERLSARELLTYFATLQGLDGTERARRVDEIIELFEITSFQNRYCGKLSTGQRQRVSIARAVLHDPPAQILGVLYNAIFLDLVDQDVLRFERMNRVLELLVMRPSRGLGTRRTRSPDLLSMIMFQGDDLRRLIGIGEADVESRIDGIGAFLER